MYGPAKRPRCPTELINPIEAAAAVPERKLFGNDQKAGSEPYIPAAATQNIDTASATWFCATTLRKSPAPATIMQIAVCQRRSLVLSDDHPTRRIVASAKQYGNAETRVTVRFDEPEAFLMRVGSQKLKQYTAVIMKK